MRRLVVRKLHLALVCALPLALTIASCKKSDDDKKEFSSESAMESDSLWQGQVDVSVQSVSADEFDSGCVDTQPLGDGWGWNGITSCKLDADELTLEGVQPSVLDNCYKVQSGQYHITELVTDVILTAGQSNAAGENTLYQPNDINEDGLNSRVLVWTENGQWEVADPATQTWHDGKYPSGKGKIYNHPAFQIGRAIADEDECRVVGIIATAASGMEIDHWRKNRDSHYTEIGYKVTHAINALPTKHQVDMIWWMQGEADNDPYVSRYYWKLNDLVSMFRSEAWFSTDGYFLANETGWFPYANEAIRMLRTDDDQLTDYSRGEDSAEDPFPSLTEQDVDVHFSEVALRKIGYLVADKYLYEYLEK